MKRIIVYIVSAYVALFTTCAVAKSDFFCNITPYIGADAQWRHMNYKKGFGDNSFAHGSAQGNFYAGLKFNDYVGLEVGYQGSAKKAKKSY